MRLIRAVEKLEEAGAAAAAAPDALSIGLAWSSREVRVEAAELAAGEYIACDIHVVGEIGGVSEWVVRERVTLESRDLGVVYGAGGDRIGRVTAVDGQLVTYRLE